MKTLLLAAGFGTRLRPLTDNVPKCLVPIAGRALLGIWLERLSSCECGPFLINTHYKAEAVASFIAAYPLRDRVTLAHEPELLGTAATLRRHVDFFGGEDGLMIHADNYCLADFGAFVDAHRRRPAGCLLSMMTFRTDTPSTCGIVALNERNIVVGFEEKQALPNGNLANGAVYLLSAELLSEIRTSRPDITDFSTQVLPALLGRIYSYETSATLIDIGTPQNYALANRLAYDAIAHVTQT
jgi:mannose-1-phosphate guanylyltransferase